MCFPHKEFLAKLGTKGDFYDWFSGRKEDFSG